MRRDRRVTEMTDRCKDGRMSRGGMKKDKEMTESWFREGR